MSRPLPRRLDNPEHKSKTEEEHIAHVKYRLKERFDLIISTEEYYELLELVKHKSKHLYRLNNNNSVKSITFKGKEMLVVLGLGSRKDSIREELPTRIKTVLYSDMKYPVPDELTRQGITQEDFTNQAKETAESIISFSKNVMPSITFRELYTSMEYVNMSNIFKYGVKKYHNGRMNFDDILIMSFRIVIEKYDKDGVEVVGE